MIEKRNLSSHIYDESEIRAILGVMDAYRTAFIALKEKLYLEMTKSS